MRRVIRSGQSGYGSEYVRARHALSGGRRDDWSVPLGPWTDGGPALYRLTCWLPRYGTESDRSPDAIYDSVHDDGRPAVVVEYI